MRFGGADYWRQGDLWPRIRVTDAVGRGFWPFGGGAQAGTRGDAGRDYFRELNSRCAGEK